MSISTFSFRGKALPASRLMSLCISELWCWWEVAFRWLPGRIGRLVRLVAYRPFLIRSGRVWIGEYTHIWEPWNLVTGNRVRIGRFNQITCTAGVSIGNDVMIGPFVVITTNNHTFLTLDSPIWEQGLTSAPIRVEDDVWIGAHCTILPGVCVGKGAVVGAGSVVTKNVQPFDVVAGTPARPIGTRKRDAL